MKSIKSYLIYLILITFIFFCGCAKTPGTVISTNDYKKTAERTTEDENYPSTDSNRNTPVMGNTTISSSSATTKSSYQAKEKICVSVVGEVIRPGVYYLEKDSRVFELINAAGGFSDDAYTDNLNLASVLSDGTQLTVLSTKSLEDASNGSTDTSNSSFLQMQPSSENEGKININTAGISELVTLPSIGNTRAEAIIDYRKKAGSFKTIEEIQNVSGIKGGTFDKIKDLIFVD